MNRNLLPHEALFGSDRELRRAITETMSEQLDLRRSKPEFAVSQLDPE